MVSVQKFPMIITNLKLPLVLKLVPNPNNIRINSQKVYSQTRTLGGYVYEHWGNAPDVINVSGITSKIVEQSRSKVENAFYQLRSLYKLDRTEIRSIIGRAVASTKLAKSFSAGKLSNRQLEELTNTTIYYKNNIYSGFFTRFDWQEDSNRPLVYIYNFEFLVTSSMEDMLRDKAFVPVFSFNSDLQIAITKGAGNFLDTFTVSGIG